MFNCFKTIFAFGSFFKEELKFKEVKWNKQGYCGTWNIFLLFCYLRDTQWCKMPFKKRMAKFEWENAISSGKIKVSPSLRWIQVISDAAAPNYSLLKAKKGFILKTVTSSLHWEWRQTQILISLESWLITELEKACISSLQCSRLFI